MSSDTSTNEAIGEINKYDFRTETTAVFKARKGLDKQIVEQISEMKNEPQWMRDFRLKSLEIFHSKPMPKYYQYYYIFQLDHKNVLHFLHL